MTEQEIQALKDERDALKSNLDKIKRKVFEVYNAQLNVSFDNKAGVYEVFQLLGDCFEIAKATPQQCLRELQAEAGRAGYMKEVEDWAMICRDDEELMHKTTDEYAAKMRKGGE